MFWRASQATRIRTLQRWRQRTHPMRMLSFRASDYTIACICPMGVESAPVEAMLDKIHKNTGVGKNRNAYTLGQVGEHNVVVAVMPETGNNAAATVATQLLNDFPSIQFGLLVGIGGGVPGDADIRLGDVVISHPTETFGGVVQYDIGKKVAGGVFQRTGMLNKPPSFLTAHVRKLQAKHLRSGHRLAALMADMFQKYPKMLEKYAFPQHEKDQLFLSSYERTDGADDDQNLVARPPRPDTTSVVHYGTIGSANVVVKDAKVRDQLRQDMKILCVEMEAAGIMSDFPCLVIRGICDYADSHKNKRWQPYAAAVAAAYMKELLTEIPTQKTKDIENVKSPFALGSHLANAPNIDSSLFIGRDAELNSIHDALQTRAGRRQLVLGGVGGIGKTQLSLAYARSHVQEFESIFWLDASSEGAIRTSLSTIGGIVSSDIDSSGDKRLDLALRWFCHPENSKWLLICDNYDNPEDFGLRKYLPTADQGAVLVTTRVPDQVGDQQIAVKPLSSVEESLKVLESRSGRPDLHLDLHARLLAGRLQGLPLALATAGTYLRKSAWTFEQYLDEYENRWNVNPRKHLQLREYQDRTLYTTWGLSYQRMEKEDPDIAMLLKLFAYFDPQELSFDLLRKCADQQELIPPWLQPIIKDDTSFENAMWVLVDYGFVDCQSQIYSMHPCIHDWVVAGLNMNIDEWSFWFAFYGITESVRSLEPSTTSHLSHDALRRHVMRLTHSSFDAIWAKFSAEVYVRVDYLAYFIQNQGVPSLHVFERILRFKQALFGNDHPVTLLSYSMLTWEYLQQGNIDLASQMYNHLCEKNSLLREWQDSRASQALLYFAWVAMNLQDNERAADNLGHILSRDIIKPIDIHECYTHLLTVNNLAVLCYEEDSLTVAESLLLQYLPICEDVLGTENGHTLMLMLNLATVYVKQNRFEEAKQLALRGVDGNLRILGDSAQQTRYAYATLGGIYLCQNRIQDAVQCFDHALVYFDDILQQNDLDLLLLALRICSGYLDQNLVHEAEQLCPRTYELSKRMLDASSVWNTIAQYNLGRLRLLQNRVSEAEPLLESAASTYRNDPSFWWPLLGLVQLYHTQGRAEEADNLLTEIWSKSGEPLPKGDFKRVNLLSDLAIIHGIRSDLEAAENCYRQALDEVEIVADKQHHAFGIAWNLVNLYKDLGRQGEVDQLLERYPAVAQHMRDIAN